MREAAGHNYRLWRGPGAPRSQSLSRARRGNTQKPYSRSNWHALLSLFAEREMDAIATERFYDAFPGHQAALDLYAGAWATAMPEGSGLQAGERGHFNEVRVLWAAKILGGLSGKTILELGPYEAYNTYQFETMGAASVVAIENSRDNFLKCLIIK